jgi:hypothetical protein
MDLEFYKNQVLQKQKEHKKFLEGLKKETSKKLRLYRYRNSR